MRSIFVLAACAAVFLGSSAMAGEQIIVGTNAEFMPFEFVNENREIVGFDIDVVNAIGRAVGMEIVIRNQAFDTLIESINSGRLDAAVSGMTITEERKKIVDFSDPYYNAAQVIVVQEGTRGMTVIEDIKDKIVGVQLGTTGALMAAEVMGATNPNLKQFRKYNEVFLELSLGRIDAIVVDLPVAQAYLKKVSGLKISSDVMSEEQYGMPVKKGNQELLDKLNAGLKKIRETGEFDEITLKWFQD